MQGFSFSALTSKLTHSCFPAIGVSMRSNASLVVPAWRIALRLVLTVALLCAFAVPAWAAAAASGTVLTTSSKTVNGHPVTVLSALVTDPNTVTQGLVQFYDGKAPIGTAQIVNTGTKYSHGTANLSLQLGPGKHVLKAVFAGTSTIASSASATQTVTVGGGTTATTISSTGTAGDYTLTSQVVAGTGTVPTGQVSFIDHTSGNAVIGSATLGTGTAAFKFGTAASYSIYDPADYSMPQQVVVADFNGDGILDLAMLDYSTGISIFLGKGDGTFQAAKPYCTTGTPPTPCQAGSEPIAIAVGDLNSDGIPDLVIAFNSSAAVILGKGDGTFLPEVNYDAGSASMNVVVGDFDRDGSPDIAVGIDGGVGIMLGNGDGTVQPVNDLSLGTNPDIMTIGDFNHDGILDLALADGSGLDVVLGVGDGTFQPEKHQNLDMNPEDGSIIAVDFKGTGYLSDLAISGAYGVEAFIGKGDGTFQTPQTLEANAGFYPYVKGLAAADLNGDGIADLALTWYSSDTGVGRVGVFYGKGDGTFNTTPKTLSVGEEPITIAAGDFDGNGALDLVVGNEYDKTLSVLLNSASNTVSATVAGVAVPGTGTHEVFAQYGGNSEYGTSSSASISLTGSGGVAPLLVSLSPANAAPSGPAFTLTVTGSGFAAGATVKWNGSARTTAFVSAEKVTAAILASDIVSPGNYTVTVKSGGITSGPLTFTVVTPVVAPVLTSLSPTTATAGGAAFALTVNGTGFVTGAILKWNGNARTTALVGATKVTAAILATDIVNQGSYSVTVSNGATTSNALTFTVTPIANSPTLTSISPNYAIVGGPAFTLTVNGSNFASGTTGSSVYWNTTALTTTYVSATLLKASVPAADIAALGTFQITVATPGKTTSNAIPFTVAPTTHTPLAYGFFNKTGMPGATSGNITCAWNTSEYLCTVTGELFFYSKYVVNVTVADTDAPAIVTVNSVGGQIIVKIFNLSGTAIEAPFYITVFKP